MAESILQIAKRADQFFLETSPIHETMRRLSKALSEMGISFVTLKTLIELKLASGITAVHRPRDLDDVIQLIRINKLGLDYCAGLNPYVAVRFTELWHAAQINEEY